ncbi:MAG: CvpA family protein [Pseudomonadota bacterium]
MSTVDLVLIGLVAISTVVGLWRGFIKEVFALAVWAFAFVAAFHFSGAVAPQLEPWLELPSARQGLAFAGIFLGILIAGGLVTWLVGQLVEKTGLSGTDRLLGAVFGAARGLLIVLTLMIAAGFTPIPADPWWAESRVIQGLMPLAEWTATFLPDVALEYFDFDPDTAGEGGPDTASEEPDTTT